MKVLMIITGGLRRNGICVSQLDYAKYIDKKSFQVDFVAVHNNQEKMIEDFKSVGCKVFELPDRRKNIFKYMSALKKLIRKEKYDIVHVHGSSSLMMIELFIAKICGVKVRIAHSRNTKCDRPSMEKLLKPIFKLSYNYALACGQEAGNWLFGNNKFEVFHNGKDMKKYSFNSEVRKNIREKYNIGEKIAFAHVGNFNEQKNHIFLINSFKRINDENKNTLLFLFGDGPLENRMKERVKELELQNSVIFLGRVQNVNEMLQGMDAMLFPSLFEGLPNVVLEWQACGLRSFISDKITEECVVCNFVKSLPIDNGVDIWANAVSRLEIETDEQREESSKIGCKALIENGFEILSNTKKLEQYYIECCKKV